jgi:hypothetical protein
MVAKGRCEAASRESENLTTCAAAGVGASDGAHAEREVDQRESGNASADRVIALPEYAVACLECESHFTGVNPRRTSPKSHRRALRLEFGASEGAYVERESAVASPETLRVTV